MADLIGEKSIPLSEFHCDFAEKKWDFTVFYDRKITFFKNKNEHIPLYNKGLHIHYYSRYENESKL